MLRVLLVDDDLVESKILTMHLERRYPGAYDLEHASTVEEAVNTLAVCAFDIIVLDNRIPPYDDYRASFSAIGDHIGGAATYVVSASTDNPIFADASRYGVTAVLDKFEVGNAIEDGLFEERWTQARTG